LIGQVVHARARSHLHAFTSSASRHCRIHLGELEESRVHGVKGEGTTLRAMQENLQRR
jgi:hypothetical protein